MPEDYGPDGFYKVLRDSLLMIVRWIERRQRYLEQQQTNEYAD